MFPKPSSIEVMLATRVEIPPEGTADAPTDTWFYELKFDGYRALAFRHGRGGATQLYSRNHKDWTEAFAPIASALTALPIGDVILDGEVCVLAPNGVTSFELLQGALSDQSRARLVYFVFDLLYANGQDWRDKPLIERKAALAKLLATVDASGPIRYSDHVESNGGAATGAAFFAAACKRHLEGIIAKRASSVYSGKRTLDWQKIKCEARQEMVIGGYTPPRRSRVAFGALLLGVHDDKTGALNYAGKVGTGFSEQQLTELYSRMQPLVRQTSPFAATVKERGAVWVAPKLVAEIRFTEWTKDGRLRHPAFLGLREDKEGNVVTRERTQHTARAQTKARATAKPNPKLTITHPERIMDRASGVTKQELADYFAAVAPSLLRFAAARPLSLVRCPDGADGHCFFQKHLAKGMPAAVHSRTRGGEELVYVDDVAGLLGLAQFNVMEIHGWGSTLAAVEKPDMMVIDLDPDERVKWSRVVAAARHVRALLNELGLTSFVKTTGGKGLHVVVPLMPAASWDTVKSSAHALAEELVRRHPNEFVATMSKAARRDRIFVDYLRNGRGATAIVPYSPRARAGANVAMPIAWTELARITPSDFTLRSVPSLLKRRRRDPWQAFDSSRIALPH